MLVRYSILAAASGSAGGNTASHGRSGQYLRARTVPTDPASPFQNQIRIIFGNISISWRSLTTAQRAAWATYAANVPVRNRLGDTIFLTGHTMYIRNNAARLQAGLDRVDDGPTIFSAVEIPDYAPSTKPLKPSLTFDLFADAPWMNDPGAAMLVYATRQASGTTRYRRTPYRFAGAVIAIVAPPAPRAIDVDVPFALTDNGFNILFVKYLIVRADGRLSAPRETGSLLITTP